MRTVVFAPGTSTANTTNIDLPSGAPPIYGIANAELIDVAATTGASSSVTATKVDENTIQLSSNTGTTDVLVLRYIAVGELALP